MCMCMCKCVFVFFQSCLKAVLKHTSLTEGCQELCVLEQRTALIDEKNSGARNGGESVGHFADFCVIDEASEEEKEPKNQEHPPQPVLAIKIAWEISREPDDKNPFDE